MSKDNEYEKCYLLRRFCTRIGLLNFLANKEEIAANMNMLKIALKNKPNFICIVPEKRKEITTEGGLNLKKNRNKIFYWGYKKNKYGPKKIQAFLEPLILFVRDDIIKANIGPKYERYTSIILTVFFFILINKNMGLLHGAANVTGNIAITLVLSFITLLVTNFSANKSYWGHIFKPPGVPLALMPIMVPIEIIGMFTKPFALMIRLFANISAGHIIILSLISLIFIAQSAMGTGGAWGVAPVSALFVLFIYCIEVLVAFLQAYIFTLLSSVFIGLAVQDGH